MRPAGHKAFAARTDDNSTIYSYEQRKSAELPPEFDRKLRGNKKAWSFFQSQAPSYQRVAVYWVTTAKKEETRASRLERLIQDSECGRRIGPAVPSRKKK
jgi:uncharacterized protein YdeI (YjbR/CyaY-like superfamily)